MRELTERMTTEGEPHDDDDDGDENPITETIETGFTLAFAFAFALAHPSRPPASASLPTRGFGINEKLG